MAKCVECGFLSLRNIETRELDETEEEYRKYGKTIAYMRSHPAEIMKTGFYGTEKLTRHVHEDLPLCFARSCNLLGLCTELIDKSCSTDKAVLTIINEKRQCDEFMRWEQGFTPKEHREMADRWREIAHGRVKESEDRQWQQQQRIEDQGWKQSQRIEDLKWREAQEKKAENRHRTDLIIIGIVATLLICAVTIIAAFIERGSLFP